ncbi:MAG TPA: LPS export ABC transporter periplasmic protein LptC [Gemmatimonadaceae bacterium]|jgi:LPS export ABC transporter protein LptC|nr:LPS export ABC transporter periplasmic protein LptC [Gemmatimonadaceae bacterium]
MTHLRLAVLAGAILAVAACTRSDEPPTARFPTAADSAEQVLYDVSTVLNNFGVARGTLSADTLYIFNDQTLFDLRKVTVAFRDSVGAPSGTMKADSGLYNTRTQVLQGWGHVVITTTRGERLESPQLRFNQLSNQVSSDTSFVLTTADGTVKRGIGFTADPGLNRIHILRAARGSAIVDSLPKR